MATEINAIINRAFDKMKEYEFMKMTQEEAETVMRDYIVPACTAYSDASDKDFAIDEKMGVIKENLSLKEQDLLASYTAIAYIDANYVVTTETMRAFLTGADFKAFDNKGVLRSVIEARNLFKSETDRYTVRNSYRDENATIWNAHRKRGRYGEL